MFRQPVSALFTPIRHALWAAGAIWVASCQDGSPGSPAARAASIAALAPSISSSAAPQAPAALTRRLRRLSSREYNSVVRDLLGDTSEPAKHFLVDVYTNGYDNGSAGLAVQSDQVVDYQSAAEALAAAAVQDQMDRLLGGCDPSTQGAAACEQAFLTTFAPRAYRRPLTDTERQRLSDAYDADASMGNFERGIQTMVEVILQSPEFLYREELGPRDATPSAGGTLRLTSYEVASELSFLLLGSLPDDELWKAVGEGRFEGVQDYSREATRLLASPGARAALRAFLNEWFATDRLAVTTKDPQFYPAFSAQLAASMGTELDQFFDYVLWTKTGSLRELFTSTQSFVDPALGQLYGISVPGDGFAPVALDARLRQGVLTRAGFLSTHSAADSSGPVARGVFVLQALMCSPPAPPPANVPAAPPADAPSVANITTRQRFARHVSDPTCAACHTRIDGVGFGFEEFDGVGAYRDHENGQPVDSSGEVSGTGEIDGAYAGVAELTEKLSGSRILSECYARQVYRYALGSVEPPDDTLDWLTSNFSTDSSMTDLLIGIVGKPIFSARAFEASSP